MTESVEEPPQVGDGQDDGAMIQPADDDPGEPAQLIPEDDLPEEGLQENPEDVP